MNKLSKIGITILYTFIKDRGQKYYCSALTYFFVNKKLFQPPHPIIYIYEYQ